jgi:hypothetical protein
MVQRQQQDHSAFTEGKVWLYRGYQVTHARDGKTVEVRKGHGQVLQNLHRPVMYEDLKALIDRLDVSAR